MKATFKIGFKIFGRIVLANVMSIITVISLTFLANVLLTEEIGYTAYGEKGDTVTENAEKLYTHYYDDGEDTKLQSYVDEGYSVNTVTIRSDLTTTGRIIYLGLCAVFCLSLAAILSYSFIWKEGNNDRNLVKFGHIKENKLKGINIGLIATAPYLLILLVCGLGKWAFAKYFPVVLYKYINASFYAPIDLICGKATEFGELAIWQLLLLVLVQLIVPLFCGIAYYLGYKDILVSDKLTYKKEK